MRKALPIESEKSQQIELKVVIAIDIPSQ